MTNEELVVEIQAGNNVQANMAELYQQNRGGIWKIAVPFSGVCEMDDLLQEAYFGLEKAVHGFDPGKGFKFMTYAEPSIRSCIQEYCATNGRSKEIPLHVISQISKYQKFRSDFRAIVGDDPTDQEYCYHLNIKPAKLKELRTYMIEHNTISLSDPAPGASGDGDRTMEEILSDTAGEDSTFEDDVLDRVAYQEGKELLWEAVADLGGNQSIIIENEFRRGYTLEMNAQQLEISKERVRQIKVKAMRLLRSSRKAKSAAECYDYGCDQAYHWGVGRFKNTGTSSTEFLALKRIESQRGAGKLVGQAEELSSSIRVIGYRFGEQGGKVPGGVRKLEEINADIDRMLQEYREKQESFTRTNNSVIL